MASFRRLFLRTLVVLALLGAALAILLFLTPFPAELLRKTVLRHAAAATGGDLEIDALEFRFFPPRLRLEGVRMRRQGAGGEEIVANCRAAEVDLPYRVYRGSLDRIDRVRVEEPEIFWRRGEGERPAPPPAAPPRAGGPPVLGAVEVRDASLRILDTGSDWEVGLRGAGFRGAGDSGAGTLHGEVAGGTLSLRFHDRKAQGPMAARVRVDGKRVEIPSFEFNRGGDPLHAAGSARLDARGAEPLFNFDVTAELTDPPGAASLFEDLHGLVRLRGEGRRAQDGPRFRAAVDSPSVTWKQYQATRVRGEMVYEPGSLALRVTEGRFLDGDLSGEVDTTWSPQEKGVPRIAIRTSLRSADVSQALRKIGLREVPLAGRFHHEGEYRLDGAHPETLDGGGTIRLDGALLLESRRAARGSGRFRIVGSRLEVRETLLELGGGHARFAGNLSLDGSRAAVGTLRIESFPVPDLKPLLPDLPEPLRSPVAEILRDSPEGVLAFAGTIETGHGGWTLAGKARAGSLRLRDARLGDLESSFQASPGRLELERLVLEGGDATLRVEGMFRQTRPPRRDSATFRLLGSAGGVDAGWIRDWTGIRAPVNGRFHASFQLGGPTTAPEGRIQWTLTDPVVASIAFDRAAGEAELVSGGVVVDEVVLEREEGRISASGTLGLGGRPIQIYANTRGAELEWLTGAGWIPFDARGALTGTAQLTGTLEEWRVEGSLDTPAAVLRGVETGAVAAHFTLDPEGGSIQVLPAERGLAVRARVRWGEPYPFEAEALLDGFQVDGAALGWDAAQTGDAAATFSGTLRATGAFQDAARLDLTGDLDRVEIRIGEETLAAASPARFRWRPPRVELEPFHLVGPGTDVVLSGQVEPAAGSYRVGAEGSFSLALLAPLWPGIAAGGAGSFAVSGTGAGDAMRIDGWVAVRDGRLQGGGLPAPITRLAGRIVLDPPDRFHLEDVRFEMGGGKTLLEGGGRMQGLRPVSLDVGATGTDVLLAYPKGFRGRYDLELQLLWGPQGGRIAGLVNLVRGVYSEDFKIESRLLSMGREEELSFAPAEPAEAGAFDPVELDVGLRADRELWIANDFATLEGRADLHLGGTVGLPEVTGRITAFEGGTIRFRRAKYRVVRGNIDLIDRDRFNPYFDLVADTRVSDYEVTLTLDGSLERFTYELTSTPPLPQSDIVALLVSGRTLDSLATGTGSGHLAEEEAAGYLTGALAEGLGGTLQNVTGLDQFSIDPVILTREGNPASRVTVGKQISENLLAAYSTTLGSTSEEVYQLEYRISRDFKFTSIRDADGSVGGDLRYVWRLSTATGARGAAARPEPKRIDAVRVEGDPGIPRHRVLRTLGLREGRESDRVRTAVGTDKLLERYRKKGYLQAVVDTREEPVEGDPGRVRVVVLVNRGPKVEIEVHGTGDERAHRKRIRELWIQSIFPEETPEVAREKLEQILRSEGYAAARVSVSVPEQTPDLRRVVLTAETGPRVRVEAIEFEGNRAVDAERLRDLLETKPGNGPYRPEVAAADAERIRRHYLALGYPDARVPAPRADLSRDGTSATLRYSIAEGDPSRVSAVRLEGNEHIPAETLLPGVPIKPGDPYLRGKVREGAEAIRLAYDRAGYADAKVSSAVEPGAEPVLVYRVEEGPRRIVGGIVLEGNLLARKEVIERELTFKPGAPLSQDEILRSQRALYRTGMFRSVDIRTEPGSDPGRPIVRIRVTESPNLTQSVGVGYDSDEGVRGLYEITNANLFGRNRTIGLQLRGSAVDSRIQALIKDPYLFNRRLDSLLSSYWERQERESFTLRTVGSTLQVSNRHGPHDRTIYRYTLKDIQLSDLEITEAEAGIQSLRLSTLAAAFVHDSRDDFLNPRRGSFASFDLGASGRGIGSEAQFVKFFSTASLFVPLLEDSVWAQSARIGLSEPFGETELVPISERFFAGGDTTVRGFRRDELGPEDPVTGNPTGGEALIILNQELRFPIWRAFRGVVFFDAGNVVSRIEDLGSIHLRPVLGTGFRIDTPIGPFRIEYGRKLDRREDEDRGRLHLSIGQAF